MNQSSENIVTRSSNHCSRRNHTPADLLAMRAPYLSPNSLLLPPSLLDVSLGQPRSGPPD